MTEDEAKPYDKPIPYWVPETRTVIVSWMMVSTFIIIICLMAWGGPKGEVGQLLNTLLSIYVGTGLVTALQWWMGSAKGSDSNNKMQDKMADAIQPALRPVPSTPDPWWNRLTDAERAAITASTDQRVKDFVAAPVTSKPLADDLAYLVSKGLLTQDRATALQSA